MAPLWRWKLKLSAMPGLTLSWSPNILRKAAVHATGPYIIPHVKVDSYAVHTNNPFTGAMRGFGAAQPPMATEAVMDMLAEKLGLHPFYYPLPQCF